MAAETHFVQRCEGPVFIGPGPGVLACSCGNTLIEGYDPSRFRAVGLACGRCATLTMTPPLPAEEPPPFAVIIAEPVAEIRTATTQIPAHVFVVGRAEMDRIAALYTPRTPSNNVYTFDPPLLDHIAARAAELTGMALPRPEPAATNPFDGMRDHPLGWAVGHLCARIGQGAWTTTDRAETSAACTIMAAFLYFDATWAHHPLFPAMVATAAADRFSLHALSLFAAAHCLTMQGNRIGFPQPGKDQKTIDQVHVATGPTEHVSLRVARFDTFEHPFGRRWDHGALRSAVDAAIGAEQGRINLKNPGLLLLSPGTALAGFDEALIESVKSAMLALGRRNRGLLAAGPILLRMQRMAAPHAIRFGYGLFPVANRHYQGESLLQEATSPRPDAAIPAH